MSLLPPQPVRMAAIRTLRKLCQHTQHQVCKLHTSASRWVPDLVLFGHIWADFYALYFPICSWSYPAFMSVFGGFVKRCVRDERSCVYYRGFVWFYCTKCPQWVTFWCAPSVMPVTLQQPAGWWNRAECLHPGTSGPAGFSSKRRCRSARMEHVCIMFLDGVQWFKKTNITHGMWCLRGDAITYCNVSCRYLLETRWVQHD